jgi:hypothetical protein
MMNKFKNLALVLSIFIAIFALQINSFADEVETIEVVEAPSADAVDKAQNLAAKAKESKVSPSLPKSDSSPVASAPVSEVYAAPSFARGKGGVSLQSAKGEKLSVAMGHYARSRALLISALREFDKGFQLVDPSALVDVDGWRNGVSMRAQELARVLDPQPRASRSGIRFDESTAGIGDAGSRKRK